MRLVGVAMLAACSFRPGPYIGADDDIDASVDTQVDMAVVGVDPPWWDTQWGRRRRVVVTTGPTQPDKGYDGYTVRLTGVDFSRGTGCDDLRVVVWTDPTWTVLPHHAATCSDVRFALPAAIADSTQWRDAFVYYDNPAASAPAALAVDDVYRFWDPATTNRSASYARGRMDPWLATGHNETLAYNAAGYYTYDTGDNAQASYRIAVDERDVYVEAEWFHTGCYTFNMQSSVCARGIILSGTGASEQADHYYCTTRAQNPMCSDTDQGIYDGDIVKTDNEIIALQGLVDPPPLVASQWRKQALAVFGAGPTNLRFWDADASWSELAVPPAAALQATGTDASDYQGRGFAGIMNAQDIGRFRGLVIRRYVEPEPVVTTESEELRP